MLNNRKEFKEIFAIKPLDGSKGQNLERHDLTVDVMKKIKSNKKIKRKEGVGMRGNTKHLVFSVCVAFVLCAFAGVASAKTIYVPDDYAKIRWAVDNASAGDTIIVRPGTYTENVDVDKSVEIRSYSQNPADTIVKASNSNDHVFYVTADNVYISGFTVTGAGYYYKAGIYLHNSNNSRIENVNASNNYYGIYLDDSSNNIIANNTVSNNDYGILLWESSGNIIANNTASSNNWGICLHSSSNNTLENNTASSNNYDGIYLWISDDNIIANNTVSSNNQNGICLTSSINISSNNNIITNNNVSSNYDDGIEICNSSNNTITNNTVLNNDCGIDLYYFSNSNTIEKNTVSNNDYGIYLWYSSGNIIYLNNFIDNRDQVYSLYSTNIWSSTEPITYIYNGKQHTNYLGNCWSDYTGSDANGDGIGDTPYSIDGETDNYPLMQPWERYFPTTPTPIPVQTFDTGRPENPYPSISGKFIGTIRTSKKVIAKKLYTYACEGTGGHTEYALICNSTWCAEAKWEGYKGDWMNISFNRTVVLMPYETYNITIVTGSYPQIHHTSSLKTENGWINCTEFTDANGKKYKNWIPAIKLWS